MPIVRFSDLYLLSQRERRALRVPFRRPATVIRAENGMGKSAIVKSLYETFGAVPHQVDQPWRGAGVSAAVRFSVDDQRFTMVRGVASYGLFDAEGRPLLRTERVEEILAPQLADLFDFRLIMARKNGVAVVPPPAYMFAPFYIDQDGGWSQAWKPFEGMSLPKTVRTLAEYHSGLKPNEYYIALAERDRLRRQFQDVVKERQTLDRTYKTFRDALGPTAVHYRLEDFLEETEALVAESEQLRAGQEAYRVALSALSEERAAWKNHQAVLSAAMKEMRGSFELAMATPDNVECPMCGAHYENSLVERFGLIEHEDGIVHAMLHANARLRQIEDEVVTLSTKLDTAGSQISKIDRILARRKSGLTFRDVVVAESRSETSRVFKQRLNSLADDADQVSRQIEFQSDVMSKATSPQRAQTIRNFFSDRLAEFGDELDVRSSEIAALKMTGSIIGRGSAHPRAFLTFFYAFLHTAHQFSATAFCPIVIDAPNQQGQDDRHMEKIMQFIVHCRPPGTQVIVATEKLHGLTQDDAEIVDIENMKHGVLRDEAYEEVSGFMRPFLGNLV